MVDFAASVLERSALLERVAAAPTRWGIERLPARLRPLWKPRNRVAARNVGQLLELLDAPSPLALVIGGAVVGNGVEALYKDPRVRLLSTDIYATPLVQMIADAHQVPLPDNSVDAVVVQAVLQQLLDPERAVAEIHRVLRPGGLVYAETPFLQPGNAGPFDFTRYTSSGHRFLFRAFEEVGAGPVAGPGSQLLAGVDHLVRGLLRSELAGKIARLLFFWLRFLDRLVPASFSVDAASAFYFLGTPADRELSPDEIITYYRGAQGPRRPKVND